MEKNKIVISIGSPIKSDDNIANLVLDRLKGLEGVKCIRAELTPENFIKPLQESKPKVIFFLDAIDFSNTPGDVKLFKLEDLQELRASTHSLPIALIQQFLDSVEIKVIGIRPKTIEFGLELSTELQDKFEDIVEEVKQLLNN